MRVKTIQAGSKEVVLVDCTSVHDEKELLDTLKEGNRVIATKPEKSVYLITDISGSKVEGDIGAAFKQYAAANTPYIKEAAVVGLGSMYRLIFSVIKTLSKRNIQLTETLDEAVQYMASR